MRLARKVVASVEIPPASIQCASMSVRKEQVCGCVLIRFCVVVLFGALPLLGGALTRAGAEARLRALLDGLSAGSLATVSAGDANGDGSVGPADIFYLISFLFSGGPPPVSLSG